MYVKTGSKKLNLARQVLGEDEFMKTNCDCCINYIYNEEYCCFECEANLDEDETGKFLRNSFDNCPYFQFNDEYKIVRKQK